jgi:GTP-binding protein
MQVNFVGSYPTHTLAPTDERPEYAFIGRSNVGKSSLINMLSGVDGLAKVSSTPGKTQMLNYFDVDKTWYLVDLPGYGFAKTPKHVRTSFGVMIDNYFNQREALQCAFLLIDACVPPQRIDLEFAEFLGATGIPFVIVFTKIDRKKKDMNIDDNILAFKKKMLERWTSLPEIFMTSAQYRTGREDVLRFIDSVNDKVLEKKPAKK